MLAAVPPGPLALQRGEGIPSSPAEVTLLGGGGVSGPEGKMVPEEDGELRPGTSVCLQSQCLACN